ncbi:MAG TPA: ROK family protein [Caulobacteraceae bacterium]|jgi:fructokinase|nr:ROK family protein [Caulobacteraceae bacterium]
MIRIGVDFGGTKIEAAALDGDGRFQARVRAPNPGEYEAARAVVRDLIAEAERQAGAKGSIGVGTPGSVSPRTGLMRNSNSLYLNGRPFREDLETTLGRPVRMANDANCLALSEAIDGAAAGAGVVFAGILGTGCGGGLVANGRLVEGRNGVAGEWGHNPLPWPKPDELPAPRCWCGKPGCLEVYISGTGLKTDYARGGETLDSPAIVAAARAGEAAATAALGRYIDRLARALAAIVNLVDPDAIVLGGGMSNVAELYQRVPAAIATHVFSDVFETPLVAAAHGDSSGVRGAAWLWPPP